MKLNMDNLSYEKLLENRDFVKKARGVLEDSFGENHSLSSDEEVLDDFYSKFREVDTNTLDAYRLYSTSSSELDDMQKKELGEVYEVYRALPSFWEDDSASNVQAFFDYASSIFTDPATYLGVATGGLASVATKAAAQGAVRAGMQTALQVSRRATVNSALAGIGTDTISSVTGDAFLQGVERQINHREDGYDYGQGAIAAASAIIPGAGIGVAGSLLKKLTKSDEMIETVAQGKQIYLEGSDAGRAFLNNEIVEGSFVQVNDKSVIKGDRIDRMAYVSGINKKNNTYTVNVGFDDAGVAVTKEIKMDKVKLVDPFDVKVAQKIERQVAKSAKIYNTERAKEGYKTFQNDLRELFKESGVSEVAMDDVEFVLSDAAVKRVNSAFVDILQQTQISYNPNLAISEVISEVIRTQPKGFSAEEFIKIMKVNGVSNLELLAVMKGETLSNAYRGTVFKAASTLGKLSGVARKAQKEMLEKELDISFGGNFQKITKGMVSEAEYRSIKSGKQYAQEVLGTTKMSPETEAYYTALLAERNDMDQFGKKYGATAHRGDQWNRMVRLGMISQPATTVRNVMGGLIRSPMDFTTRTVDNIITSALNKFTGTTIRPVNLSDGFDHLNSLLAPQEYEAMTKLIMSKKPLAKDLLKGPEGYLEMAKIAQTLNGDKIGTINKVFGYASDPLERGLVHVNILNSIQDKIMKSQSFIVGLRQSMLRDELNLDDFVRNAQIEKIDDRYIAEAMQWAMEFNYQKNIRGDYAITQFGIETLNKISNIPFVGSAVVPFPKFMINSMKFMYEHAPVLGSADLIAGRKGIPRALGKEGNAYLQQQAINRISKQVTGGALLTLAYAIRTSEVGGEHWDEIMDGNGNTQNIGTWYPLAPALWIADFIVQIGDMYRQDYTLPDRTTVRDVGDFKSQWWEDTAKALGGPSSRAGIWRELDKNFFAAIFGGEQDKLELLQSGLGRATGTIVAALAMPLKIGADIVAETNGFGLDESARMLHDARNSEGFTENFLSEIFKNLPFGHSYLKSPYAGVKKGPDGRLIVENHIEYKYDGKETRQPRFQYSVLNAKPLVNVSPLYKQFTGTFRKRRRNEIEKEFARLGIPEWRLFKRTNIPEYDRALMMIQGNLVERHFTPYLTNPKYLQWNDSGKERAIKSELSRMRKQIAQDYHDSFHLGMLGSLSKQPKSAKNQAHRMLQAKGMFPRDRDLDVGLGFDLSREEAKVLLEITKEFKKANYRR